MFEYVAEYENFNGVMVKEVLHFHLSKQEIIHMQTSSGGLLTQRLERIINTEDSNDAIEEFREIILLSYGELSPNGNRFHKSPEIRADFEASPAFDALYMKMFEDPDFAGKFITGILPKNLDLEEAKKAAAEKGLLTMMPGA